MNKLSKFLIAPTMAMTAMGCATQPMMPRSETIPIAKDREAAYSSVMGALARAGYVIQTSDKGAGLINTRPKEFSISRGIASISYPATIEAQILINGKSADIQTTFKCSYGGAIGYQQYRLCIQSDGEAQGPIQVEDVNLRQVVVKALKE